jgi:RNA-directed DNA polymerase
LQERVRKFGLELHPKKTRLIEFGRYPADKRMAAKPKKIRQPIRERLHERTTDTTAWLQSVVRAYFRYHAVPYNEVRLKAFRHEVLRMWWWQFRRRSQQTRWTRNNFGVLAWKHIRGKNRVR